MSQRDARGIEGVPANTSARAMILKAGLLKHVWQQDWMIHDLLDYLFKIVEHVGKHHLLLSA